MTQPQFCLSWNSHKKNICNGLSILQQNGEFVDMTLAADGHMVKVHQIIMALASPYIKELIASANCPHPVIFLNKMSYKTLCAMLEYIYTGEVLISTNDLDKLIEAGRELHIKGLEEMNIKSNSASSLQPQTTDHDDWKTQEPEVQLNTDDIQETGQNVQDDSCMQESEQEEKICYFEIENPTEDHKTIYVKANAYNNEQISMLSDVNNSFETTLKDVDSEMIVDTEDSSTVKSKNDDKNMCSQIQYTVSNQGSLQLILNRFLYYLKHSNLNRTRQWRCVDYLNSYKCPAHVVTRDDAVVQRIAAHTHPFHDKRILKKARAGAIFSAIDDALQKGTNKKIKTHGGVSVTNEGNE